jgi:AAA+ superfamily predicted ATPase
MSKQKPAPNQRRSGIGSSRQTRTKREDARKQFDQLLLRLKLEPLEERVRLVEELAAEPGLTPAQRRMLIIATQRYVMSGRGDKVRDYSGLLSALLKIANKLELRIRVLRLFLVALEGMERTEVVERLKPPLDELVRKFVPRSAGLDFSPELVLKGARRLDDHQAHDAVVQLLSLGLFFFPFHDGLREMRAEKYLEAGNSSSALSDYDRLVEMYPDRHRFLVDRADAAMRVGEFEDALEDLRQYSRTNPGVRDVREKQAECLLQMGRNFEALEVINSLIEMEGGDADLLVSRARINEQLEFLDDALRDAEKALEHEPGHQEARQLRQSTILRRSSFGMEDDLYTAFVRGDEEVFLGELKVPDTRFSDIGGLDEIKQLIRETIEYPLKYPGVSEKYGKQAGGGLLFFGPPGCGKTLLVRAAAGECGITLINVNLAQVLDKWVGNSEKAISMMFTAARKRAPSILFFDELDAIGGSRANMQTGWEKKVISQLLVEMDGLTSDNRNVMVLGATNSPWEVDFALRRPGRLGRLVFVSPPDAAARADIFKLYLGQRPYVSDGIDYALLGAETHHYSPDAIRQVVENAASIPWRAAIQGAEPRPIGMEDVMQAIKDTPSDLAEWEKVVSRYEEFAKQSLKKPSIGFRTRK